MSENEKPKAGTVGWLDLTVEDADGLREFYSTVVGWTPKPFDMGGYSDYVMETPSGDAVAGVCHARGSNADLPPQWLPYFVVEDVERAAADCERLGGSIIAPIRSAGGGRYCVVRDPAGAACALFQS